MSKSITKNKIYFMVLDTSLNVMEEIYDSQTPRNSNNYIAIFNYLTGNRKIKNVQILFKDKVVCTIWSHEIESAKQLSHSEKKIFEKQAKSGDSIAVKRLFLENMCFGGIKWIT